MSQGVSSCIFQIICQHGGSLDWKTLEKMLRQHFTVADEVLVEELSDFEKFLVVAGRERREDSVIITKTSLRVCQDRPGQCEGCEELHLCRYFVCGNCRFGQKCKNHDLNSTHNTSILNKLGLQYLGKAELFQLLLQNDSYFLPEVCSHYNKGKGDHGSCKFQTTCTNLHVCQHFLQEDCKYGDDCKRAHGFDATVIKLLKGRGFSPENISNFYKIYKNWFLISSYKERPPIPSDLQVTASPNTASPAEGDSSSSANKPVSRADSTEICLFSIRGGCIFKDKCVRVHCRLPYKWQILDKYGQQWKDLVLRGQELERAYCNPANDASPGARAVNFISMTCGGLPVRRLSTPSSVTKPPYFKLTTEWLWYWKNEKGEWVEYGQGEDDEHATSQTSQTIENIYQCDPQSEVPVRSDAHNYIIYLKDMYQQNVLYKTKREIRRRPRFVSVLEVKDKLKSESSSSSSVEVPAQWDRGALPNFSYKLVTLSKTDADFVLVEKLFKQTMPNFTIINMQRNQNISLWKMFQWQKEQMKERNGGSKVEERLLFHGTDESLTGAICEQNFDWRICGKHGTLYGKGSYFARDASYSDQYSEAADDCKKAMFVARVLVGHYTHGDSSFVRPPATTKGKGFHDSCVDDISDPSIFVIFEKFQIYPEFLIEYTPEKSTCLFT